MGRLQNIFMVTLNPQIWTSRNEIKIISICVDRFPADEPAIWRRFFSWKSKRIKPDYVAEYLPLVNGNNYACQSLNR